MLTSYLVKCPHVACNWFGSLLPNRNAESFRQAVPSVNIASFTCPKCNGQWNARVKGDDVEPLPLEEVVGSV